MPVVQHDRRNMALAQLDRAIALYFENADFYSVITLAGAADEIFGQILKAKGREPHLESIKTAVVEISRLGFGRVIEPSKVAERANFARNALKHWSEGQPLIVDFDAAEEAKDMLERAISNYWALESRLSPNMERFHREIRAA